MARDLTAAEISRLTKIGNHRIAQSLYLRIVGENSRTYAFRYKVHGKDRWKSIGPVHVIPLADAKAKVLEWMLDVRSKREPGKSAKRITFALAAGEAIASLCAGLSPSSRRQWEYSLLEVAAPHFGSAPMGEITPETIRALLMKFWISNPAKAERLKFRLNRVFQFARAAGYCEENPASHERLKPLLPRLSRVVTHHPSMPFKDVPAFMMQLKALGDNMAAIGLRFTILTAARAGETVKLDWKDIDLANRIWRVPPPKQKSRRVHEIPLSSRALAILATMQADSAMPRQGQVFALKDTQNMLNLLRRLTGDKALTVHGFRSSFADFAAAKDYPDSIIEASLAHIDLNKTRAAYRRDERMDKRRELMNLWGRYADYEPQEVRERRVRHMAGV